MQRVSYGILFSLAFFSASPFGSPLAAEEPAKSFLSTEQEIRCEGTYPRHLQGVCIDDREAIFWSFTDVLVKTDRGGRLVKKIPVADHHGDLCFHDGKVYVAVNLGKFNRPAGEADSWVFVYDAATLEETARHRVPEVVHGAGGIAFDGERFLVVGGLPPGVEENYLYEYDEDFAFRKRHTLASGYTLMGIQTAAYADGRWLLGCYGAPQTLLTVDPSLARVERREFDASLGIVGLPEGGLLVARGACDGEKGCTGRLVRAIVDPEAGLRLVD